MVYYHDCAWRQFANIILVALAACGLQVTRGFLHHRSHTITYKIEREGQQRLVKQITDDLLLGMGQKESKIPSSAAAILSREWTGFVGAFCQQAYSYLWALVYTGFVLAIRAPILLIPLCVATALSFSIAQFKARTLRARAATVISQEYGMLRGLELLLAGCRMQWLLRHLVKPVLIGSKQVTEAAKREHKLRMTTWLLNHCVEIFMYSCAMSFILVQYSDPDVSRSKLVGLTVSLLAAAYTWVVQLSHFFTHLRTALTSLGRADSTLKELGKPPAALPPAVPKQPHEITVRDVKKYGCVYHTITLEPGITYLDQESGWGKSTVLRLIAGVIKPDSGQVLIDGQSTNDVDVRDCVLFVDQSLPSSTIKSKLFFNEALSQGERENLLEELGLSSDMVELETQKLSGGQTRRMYLAAAMSHAQGRVALLFDEPTNGLDVKNANLVLDMIKRFHDEHPEYIIVIASHDEKIQRIAKRQIVQ